MPLKIIFLLQFLLCFLLHQNIAQREIIELDGLDFIENHSSLSNQITRAYEIKAVPIENAEPFIAISVVWYSDEAFRADQRFWLAMGKQSAQWSEFHSLWVDPHSVTTNGRLVSNLIFASKEITQFRLYLQTSSETPPEISSIEIHFFNPKPSEINVPNIALISREGCVCPQPAFLDRTDWCPDGTCPPDATPVETEPTHLVIHHSATSNTSSDWAATVRSIWDFHVNTNGWDDIGYNWLIDPLGNLYEGRGDNRLGAHFCSTNGGTVGIAMLGNFEVGEATNAAKETLKDLLAWKSCDIDAHPLAEAFHLSSNQTLHHILGHRDGCATACPGENFYPLIPDIRSEVLTIREEECDVKLSTPELMGEAINANFIKLDWIDNSEVEEGFILERSANGNDFNVLAELPANTTSYDDDTTEPATTYKYRVKAISAAILDSDWSNEVTIFSGTNSVANQYLNAQTVQIFPNPNNGNFNLSIENALKGQTEIQLLDLAKRPVTPILYYQKTSKNFSKSLSFENLSAGVYFLKIAQEGKLGWFKFNISK